VIVLAQRGLQADARTVGLVFSFAGAGGLVGAVIAPRLGARLRIELIVVGALALQAAGTAVVAGATGPVMVIVGGVPIFLGLALFNVTLISYRLALIPDELQGRVNSMFRLLASGGQPLGMALGGLLLGPLGPRAELGLIAVGFALCATWMSRRDLQHATS
jgi:MFS family permease